MRKEAIYLSDVATSKKLPEGLKIKNLQKKWGESS